jgi:hypothetical protein
MSHRKSQKSVLSSVIAVMSLAAVAVWQFYVFVTFKDTTGIVDVQGGRLHLWWAIGFGLMACIAAILSFSIFLRYDRSDEMHITSQPS